VNQKPDIFKSLRQADEHFRAGRLSDAERAYEKVLKKNPRLFEALHRLGLVLLKKGEANAAAERFSQAILQRPGQAVLYDDLADALTEMGRFNESVAARQKAIELDPTFYRPRFLLGNLLGVMGRYDEAIAQFEAALKIRPDDAEAIHKIGFGHFSAYRLDEALEAYETAERLAPKNAAIKINLGHAWSACGRHDRARASFDAAMALQPRVPEFLSSRIFAMHFDRANDAGALLAAGRHWDATIAEPLQARIVPLNIDRQPDRKLRIGLVSPDFRKHVVGVSMEGLLAKRDREHFEVFCYANVRLGDDVTEKIRGHTDGWRDIFRCNDEKAAQIIREDRIDILIDLALHSFANRLPVFARRPAPVQVTYLGYCSTTGLSAMDYRLSDPHIDPGDAFAADYSEKTISLPRTHLYYGELNPSPEVSPCPSLSSGNVTFGCLNKFAKCSSAALDLWLTILRQLPGSRLLLHALPGKYLEDVRNKSEAAGVDADRLEFVGRQNWAQYIQTFSRVDVGLDPFPYNGGITTCDALWMGVPVVTLTGRTAVNRAGRSILTNAGLSELVADTPEQYVRLACELAGDVDRRRRLRGELRQRVLDSPLKDAGRLMGDIETALRGMWTSYCKSNP
jgi:predicted O-linked N-acetylglucosamine transferase (SPINDLY family)